MSIVAVINEFSVETIRDTLQKLNDFTSLKVNGLNAHQLSELEAIDPELFAAVAEMIKADRWFPYVGTWTNSAKLSDLALIKSCLYSSRYFAEKFGKKYRVFHGEKIYGNLFAQIIYSSLFDSAVLTTDTKSRWVQGTDGFRTLVINSETVDVNDIDDDFIVANSFATYEELSDGIFMSDFDIETEFLPACKISADEIEKSLVKIEKELTLCGINKQDKLKTAWIAHLDGDNRKAEEILAELGKIKLCDKAEISVGGDGVELLEIKFSEDNNGDVIIRTVETCGKEKSAYIVCNKLNTGFRFEILPHEIQSYRISKDGSVKEIYICE